MNRKLFFLVTLMTLLVVLGGCMSINKTGKYFSDNESSLSNESTLDNETFLDNSPMADNRPLTVRLGYSEDDILVIVHADDLGMHKDETDGSLEAMKYGMCKTGSIMVPCPDFERTIELYKENPELDIGIHLTLNSEWKDIYTWTPILSEEEVPSLYNDKGVMWTRENDLIRNMNVEEAKLELEAQIKKALDTGVKFTHIDAHMGCYFRHPDLFIYATYLSKKYNLPMVVAGYQGAEELRSEGYVFTDSYDYIYNIDGEENNPDLRRQLYYEWLGSLKPGVHEIIVHIANVTDELAEIIEMPYIRSGDYNVWTSPETKERAEELGIKFIGYRELQELQTKNWGL